MSVLGRRVQILVERAQYARLERAAAAESRSVASLIREAITEYLDDGSGSRARALDWLLAQPRASGPGEDWTVSKEHLESAVPGFGMSRPVLVDTAVLAYALGGSTATAMAG